MSLSRISSGSNSADFPGVDPLADSLPDPRLDRGDLLLPSYCLSDTGDFEKIFAITEVNKGLDDEDRPDLSFFSCLPRSVPEDAAGAAKGLLSRSSLMGERVGALTSSLPPLLLLFLPKVTADSDDDWAVEGAAIASSNSMFRRIWSAFAPTLNIRLITYQRLLCTTYSVRPLYSRLSTRYVSSFRPSTGLNTCPCTPGRFFTRRQANTPTIRGPEWYFGPKCNGGKLTLYNSILDMPRVCSKAVL